MDGNIGHNLAPEDQAFEQLKDRTDELVAAAERALTNHPEITDEDLAGTFADFLTQLRGCTKDIEATRKEQKQPHIDASKAVDERFNGLKRLIDICRAKIEPIQTAWLRKERERLDAERREREREAYEAMKAEEEAKAKAATGGIAETVAAEEAAKKSEQAVADAEKAAQAKAQMKGSGDRAVTLRTSWHARITDYDKALDHYRDHPQVRDLIQRLADADARSPEKRGTAIPGVEFHSEQKAA